MKIWILTIGEPLPIKHSVGDRLHRSGYFAKYLSEHNHEVVFWTSAFDHFKKIFYSEEDDQIKYNKNLLIYALNGGGYMNNISFSRFRDHRRIAKQFERYSDSFPAPDIILASLPTVDLCHEALTYGAKNNFPVVLDMRDMWPDIFVNVLPKHL